MAVHQSEQPLTPQVLVIDAILDIARAACEQFGAGQMPHELVRYLHWVRAVEPVHVVEVGTATGGLAWAVRQICPRAHLVLVDVDEPEHLKEIVGSTEFVRGRSEEVAGFVSDMYDPMSSIVFIDADHHYDAVVRDARLYPAAYQAFHDIVHCDGNSTPPGEGADKYFREHNMCCFIGAFWDGGAGIGIRMPKFCKECW